MVKAISGHSAPKCGMAMAIPVAPPLPLTDWPQMLCRFGSSGNASDGKQS